MPKFVAKSSEATGLAWAVDPVADIITTAGDLIYGTAADTVARLGIGTAGQVLKVNSGATAPEWASPSSSTSWSLLNSGGTALTGAATITVSGLSAKNKLMILLSGASSDVGFAIFSLRLNSDTGSNYYQYGYQHDANTTYSSGSFTTINTTATSFALTRMSDGTTSAGSGFMIIDGAKSTGLKMINQIFESNLANGSSGHRAVMSGGYWNNSATVSSVSIIANNGNFDAGTIYIYGAD